MNNFIAVIEDMIQLFEDLVQVEQVKLEAAKKNRVTYVEDCMNKEQAAILKLRGLDKKREDCQEQLGMKGDTFQQILSKVSEEEERDKLKQLFDRLSYQVRLFQEISDGARSMIEINLHMIDKAIRNSQGGIAPDNAKWEGLL
ncbi:flagellar export chaperone FlgN [Lacrimispora celerecrescens]|uniref:flagellar export chaperone FlgN n=1 Tax=Lacrimispora celerecrescens TaxID=29354 RepID=UPI00068EC0BE|nr:flagellar export chaperone FlgN [Lacrimispora celerecrescens]MBW4844714.1 flagellar protein FlgN [Lachnospiraceae bacterium]